MAHRVAKLLVGGCPFVVAERKRPTDGLEFGGVDAEAVLGVGIANDKHSNEACHREA